MTHIYTLAGHSVPLYVQDARPGGQYPFANKSVSCGPEHRTWVSRDMVHSSDTFWAMEGACDVVHLHFPEYLTFELQDAYIHGLTLDLIDEVRVRLEHWSSRAVIVVTRHVLLPHAARDDPMWVRLYELVYSYADGVVHFGESSRQEFAERYARTLFRRGSPPLHTVVPHQNYASLPNTVSADEARRILGIASDACVIVVFGAIRNLAERQLILDTFQNLSSSPKLLLVSRWMEILPDVSWIRLKYWLRDLTRLYYRIRRDYHFNYDFVREDDTQIYLNAADVLFIPRLRVLNSGNVTLGLTFGRIVVGPDSWDVGELLRNTGNPVFDPDLPGTAAEAVERGFQLSREGKVGPSNRELAISEWGVDKCAAKYVRFFDELARARTTRAH